MINPKSKSSDLSESTKTHLIDVFCSWNYERKEEVTSKFLDKGNDREEDSITLLSRVLKQVFIKNEVRFSNEYITGEPDLFNNGSEIFDTKTCWSLNTFLRAKYSEINKMYEYQGHGYMALTEKHRHNVAYCLVNGTEKAINDEKRRLAYSMGIIDTSTRINDEYKKRCRQIEINHIFDIKEFENEYPWFDLDNEISQWKWDIPKEERLHIVSFERNDEVINKMYDKVKVCRKWIKENLSNESKVGH